MLITYLQMLWEMLIFKCGLISFDDVDLIYTYLIYFAKMYT